MRSSPAPMNRGTTNCDTTESPFPSDPRLHLHGKGGEGAARHLLSVIAGRNGHPQFQNFALGRRILQAAVIKIESVDVEVRDHSTNRAAPGGTALLPSPRRN